MLYLYFANQVVLTLTVVVKNWVREASGEKGESPRLSSLKGITSPANESPANMEASSSKISP